MTPQHTYDHVAHFLADMNPQKMLELKAPEHIRSRLESLMHQEKESGLSETEKDELDHYLVLERLIRLAKAHARVQLAAFNNQ